jgi:hypothetical protein
MVRSRTYTLYDWLIQGQFAADVTFWGILEAVENEMALVFNLLDKDRILCFPELS